MAELEKKGQQEVDEEDQEVEEYVLLDLDSVANHIRIPENAPYVLTGLDTLNPILVIDNKIKLIGEYTETIGTGLIFSESEQEVGPCDAKINPMGQLNKVLKFNLCLEADRVDATNQ